MHLLYTVRACFYWTPNTVDLEHSRNNSSIPIKDDIMSSYGNNIENCNECEHFIEDIDIDISSGPNYCTYFEYAVMGDDTACDAEELE